MRAGVGGARSAREPQWTPPERPPQSLTEAVQRLYKKQRQMRAAETPAQTAHTGESIQQSAQEEKGVASSSGDESSTTAKDGAQEPSESGSDKKH